MLLRQPKKCSSSSNVNYHLVITVLSTLTITALSVTYYRLTGNTGFLFKQNNMAKSQGTTGHRPSFPKFEQTRVRRAGSSSSMPSAMSPSTLLCPKSTSDIVSPPSSSAPAYFVDEREIKDSTEGLLVKDHPVFEGPPTFQNAQRSNFNNRIADGTFPAYSTIPKHQPVANNNEPDSPKIYFATSFKKPANDDHRTSDILLYVEQSKNLPRDQWLSFIEVLVAVRNQLLENLEKICIRAKLLAQNYVQQFVDQRPAWFWAAVCSLVVVSTGVVPAFFVPECYNKNRQIMELQDQIEERVQKKTRELRLNQLLCFAVGSLLGDVFFHLLPESWSGDASKLRVGLYVIGGLLVCLLIEKFCAKSEESQHYVAALANLAANIMDNFTHGLAVGGSFLISKRLGFLTTFAILLHEIPHEISDFAILLRANFDKWSALKAQLITASGGLLGTFVAFWYSSKGSSSNPFVEDGNTTSWILPFTAGGFLNIALIQILPDILKERRFKESMGQILLIVAGIAVMALLNSPLFSV